jgi:VanZ family protein
MRDYSPVTALLLRAATPPRAVRWLLVLAWMALIFWWSSVPNLAVPHVESSLVQTVTRKIVHLLVYGTLALLVCWALPDTPGRSAIAFAFSVLYAISDEIHQSFVPTREGASIDIVIDATAAHLRRRTHGDERARMPEMEPRE